MKIALACFKYSSDERHPQDVVLLGSELAKRGHEVTLYCRLIASGSKIPDFIRVRKLDCPAWTNASRAKKFIRKLHEALRSDKPDALVAFNRIPGADFYYATTRCIATTPLTNIFRKWTPRYRVNLALEKRLFRPRNKCCILHVSEQQKREYQWAYGTPDRRFVLLPPDIPDGRGRPQDAADRRSAMRSRLKLEEDDILIMTMGRFRESGADRSIGALASLPDEYRKRCQLILAGSGNVSGMRYLAERLGVDRQLRFTVIDDEVNDVLLASDLLLHPARTEEAGTAPLEALAAGVPVLANAAGGWGKEIVECESLLLPSPFHQIELNRALRLLLSNPLKLEEMTREAGSVGANLDLRRRFETAADVITAGSGK